VDGDLWLCPIPHCHGDRGVNTSSLTAVSSTLELRNQIDLKIWDGSAGWGDHVSKQIHGLFLRLHNKFLAVPQNRMEGKMHQQVGYRSQGSLRSWVGPHEALLQAGTIDCCGWAGKPGPSKDLAAPISAFKSSLVSAQHDQSDRGGITGDPPVMFHHSRCTSLNGIKQLSITIKAMNPLEPTTSFRSSSIAGRTA